MLTSDFALPLLEKIHFRRGNRPLIEFLLYLCPEAASVEDKASFWTDRQTGIIKGPVSHGFARGLLCLPPALFEFEFFY